MANKFLKLERVVQMGDNDCSYTHLFHLLNTEIDDNCEELE